MRHAGFPLINPALTPVACVRRYCKLQWPETLIWRSKSEIYYTRLVLKMLCRVLSLVPMTSTVQKHCLLRPLNVFKRRYTQPRWSPNLSTKSTNTVESPNATRQSGYEYLLSGKSFQRLWASADLSKYHLHQSKKSTNSRSNKVKI